MPEATMRTGDPRMIPYTPAAGNVAAGQVIALANTGIGTLIAHQDIANNVQGSVACGGGIYDVTMLTNIAPYARVYWDDTNNKVVTTSTLPLFGFLIEGNTGANTVVKALHWPMQAT